MTPRSDGDGDMRRRQFLRRAGALALSAAGTAWTAPALPALQEEEGARKAAWEGEPKGPFAPFRMALQSYSLRKFDFQKAIDAIYALPLNLVELWPEHLPRNLEEAEFRGRIKAMRYNMLRRIAYGVVPFGKDHEANWQFFDFARKLGVYALTADPAPESFESLEKLVEEFKIAVAIHNHGPEDRKYGTPDLIDKALKDRHRLIGVCVDTGHFLRAGVNPVEAVKRFKGRVYAVHLKDLKSEGGKKEETILGRGDLDLAAFLRALKESDFKGGLALEYEKEPENPIPPIEKCLKAVKEALKKL